MEGVSRDEEMRVELGATLTLAFAGVGALGTVYTVVDGFPERAAREEAEARAWFLITERADEAGQ